MARMAVGSSMLATISTAPPQWAQVVMSMETTPPCPTDGRRPALVEGRPTRPGEARPRLDSCSGQNRPPAASWARFWCQGRLAPLTDRFRVVWAILEALTLLRLQRSRPLFGVQPLRTCRRRQSSRMSTGGRIASIHTVQPLASLQAAHRFGSVRGGWVDAGAACRALGKRRWP